MITQKTTKQIHKEWEQRRFKQLTRGYGDNVWLLRDELKSDLDKLVVSLNMTKAEFKAISWFIDMINEYILCNSQEQKGDENK